jgi:MFS family permease
MLCPDFSYMLFAPLFGYLGDRHSRKLIMAIGVLIWVVATLVGSFMTVSPDNWGQC